MLRNTKMHKIIYIAYIAYDEMNILKMEYVRMFQK